MLEPSVSFVRALAWTMLVPLATAGCSSDGSAGPDVDAGELVDGGSAPDGGSPDAGPPDPVPDELHTPERAEHVQPGDDWHAAADTALVRLTRMYDPLTGMFNSGHMWTWASGIEASITGFERSTGAKHQYMWPATRDLRGFADFLEEFGYDDQAWWGNAWVRAYDATGNEDYLALARRIFADMLAAWDETSCGGGVWWNPNEDFKNAITAELFILLAANLHNRVPGDTEYLGWAERSWDWFMDIGMVNDRGLINDGLRECENRGEPVWTYNQGVILGAAVELHRATQDDEYLSVATRLADASTTLLVDDEGILRERCEGPGNCNDDQSAFKGIYLRYLMALYDATGNETYGAFIQRHARSIWASRGPGNAFGLSWNGPVDRIDSQRQIAAANALLALAPPSSADAAFVRAAGGTGFNHSMGHRVGTHAWGCDLGSCPEAGLFQTGPYLASLPPGEHTAHAQLSVSHRRPREDVVATIEVYDTTQDEVLASRPVRWDEFIVSKARHDFVVAFEHDGEAMLELRARWHAVDDAPAVHVHDVSIGPGVGVSAASLDHGCGRLDPLERWIVDRARDAEDCVMLSGGAFAPAPGPRVARFELQVDDFFHDDAPVATLAVLDRETGAEVASRTVGRDEFTSTLLHGFDVPFEAAPFHAYEVQVTRRGSSDAPTLRMRAIHIRAATTQVTVALPYTHRGIAREAGAGDLDGAGNAFADDALHRSLVEGRVDFELGPVDGLSVVATAGQAVALPGTRQRALYLLVLAVGGAQTGTFRIDYRDGTSTTITRTISDWWSATDLEPNEEYAVASAYLWKATGRQYGDFHAFLHTLPLDATKEAVALTLPQNPAIKLFAVTADSPVP